MWRRNSSKVRTDIGVPKVSSPWSQRAGVELTGVSQKSKRQVDLVDVAFESRLKDTKGKLGVREMTEQLWCDLSLTVLRRPWTAARLRPFRARGHLYSFAADRCVSGADCMRLLGWPVAYTSGAPASDLLTLSAENMSLPLVTLLQLGMWCNPFGSWHEAGSEDATSA